ncbi:MAG: response regulator, partial [Verrucomicrobiota bacterium]
LDLRGCIEDALDLLAAKAAEKKLDIAYQIEDGIPPYVIGDITRLRQILVNLLSNGIKFTQTGEVVAQVKLLSPPTQGGDTWHLHFSVRDTGIGIPVDRLARLFKSFSQADASTTRHYGGTGLGLAISKRLVELMDGKMWVESIPQKGSTFHFTLPMAAAPAPEMRQIVLEGRQPHLADLRLLVVDDNPTNCRILALQAGKWGMIPRAAQNASQALEFLRSGETFDLAILDMQMPGMDGLMLAAEIRKLPSAMMMPLVLLTSMGVRSDSPDFATAAFASCLTKPIKPAQLHEVLLRVISGAKPAAKKLPVPSKLDPTLSQRMPLRLLLCDDNVINQKVAARLLQQMGYKADITGNGLEALAALDQQQYDLIFMDIQMPEMDGMEATKAIRERQRDRERYPHYKSSIVIVAMTANAMTGDREKCLAAGMDDYLSKPVRPEDVRRVIERWGATATMPDAPAPIAAATATATGLAEAETKADEPPVVEMERLLDFTNGNADDLRELVTLYISQTGEQIEQLAAAVAAGSASEVRRLAHSCAGASATCGISRIVPLLRELEKQGNEGHLIGAAERAQKIQDEFKRIRVFLENYLQKQTAMAANT